MTTNHTTPTNAIAGRFPVVGIRGLPITACTMDAIQDVLAEAINERQRCRIATVNLDFLRLANERPDVQSLLESFEMCVADGWPLLRLAEMQGSSLPERVTGSDLVPRIMRWADMHGWRVGLVGGMPETEKALAEDSRFANVICGHWMPRYEGLDVRDPELSTLIRFARPDILLVALGCPKQEKWISENLSDTGASVAMGIGASLEFLAGVKSRAPKIVQRLNMEFAYRLMMEPRRLGMRYYRDYLFWRQAQAEARRPAALA